MLVRSEDFAPRDRMAFWRDEVCPHLYRIETDGGVADDFRFMWDVRDIGAFGFAHIEGSVVRRRRTPADIRRDGQNAIALQRAVIGPVEVSFLRETVNLQQGDWVVLAVDWPCEMRASTMIGLRILELPRSVLSPLLTGGTLGTPVRIPSASPLGAILAAGVESTWENITALDPALGEGALRHLAGLIALACGASADGAAEARTAVAGARLKSAQAQIARHLAEPELSPAYIAAMLGVTPRYLHRLFEPTGTSFGEYVTHCRLAACRAALENPAERGRSVADIALGWGFGSLPTFYRTFAAAYGCSPSDLRPSVP